MTKIELEKSGDSKLKTTTNGFEPKLIIKDDARITCKQTGKFIARYITNSVKNTGSYFDVLNQIKMAKSNRTSGITSRCLIFGSAPEDPLKNLPARKVKNEPNAVRVWSSLNETGVELFKRYEPEIFDSQLKKVSSTVGENWRLKGGAFTSGIINRSNQLVFHTDNGNVPECLSVMFCFKRGIEGGRLFLPEYESAIEIENGSCLIFDGQSVSHGVEKFRKLNEQAERFTIVLYALEKLKRAEENGKKEIEKFNRQQLRKLK